MFVKTIVLRAETQANLRRRTFLTILAVWCRNKPGDFVAFGICCAFVNGFLQCHSMSKTIHFPMAQCNYIRLDQKEHFWLAVSWFWRSYNKGSYSPLIYSPCVSEEHVRHFFIYPTHTIKNRLVFLLLSKHRSPISVLIHCHVNPNPKCPALHLKDLLILSVPQSILLYSIWTLIVESIL